MSTALQRRIASATGLTRRTSGAATKVARNIRTAARRASRGGGGG